MILINATPSPLTEACNVALFKRQLFSINFFVNIIMYGKCIVFDMEAVGKIFVTPC